MPLVINENKEEECEIWKRNPKPSASQSSGFHEKGKNNNERVY